MQTANCGASAVAVLFFCHRRSLRDAEADFLGLFSRPEFPQLPFIDKVFDVPFVQVHLSSLIPMILLFRKPSRFPMQFIDKESDAPVVRVQQVWVQFARRQLGSHSCSSSFCVDTVVHIPVVVQ